MPPGYGEAKAFICSDDSPPTAVEPEPAGKGMIAEFVDYALDGAETSLTTEESIRSHRAVVLCRMSAKAGRPLKWREEIG